MGRSLGFLMLKNKQIEQIRVIPARKNTTGTVKSEIGSLFLYIMITKTITKSIKANPKLSPKS